VKNIHINSEDSILHAILDLYGKSETEIESINIQTIHNLLIALNRFNNKILEHSIRVSYMSRELAKALDYGTQDIKRIVVGALLHDIGVIGLKKELFNEEITWSEEKLIAFYRHTALGREIINPIPFLKNIMPLIENHHEYLNGSGHPNALQGFQISLDVRMLTAVNDLDMMSEFFPWGKKLSCEKSLGIIKKHTSILYDKRVIDALLTIFSKRNIGGI